MGKPVKILDLALNLIRLSGLKPYEDIDIVFTGLRPGEKLYEELLMDEEGLQSTDNELIHIGKPIDFDEELFIHQLAFVGAHLNTARENLRMFTLLGKNLESMEKERQILNVLCEGCTSVY